MTTITWSPGRIPWSGAAPAGGIGSATAPRCAWLTLIWIAASSIWCWPTRPYPRADGNDPLQSRLRRRLLPGHRPACTAVPPRKRARAIPLAWSETTGRASEKRKSNVSPSRVKRARSGSSRAPTRPLVDLGQAPPPLDPTQQQCRIRHRDRPSPDSFLTVKAVCKARLVDHGFVRQVEHQEPTRVFFDPEQGIPPRAIVAGCQKLVGQVLIRLMKIEQLLAKRARRRRVFCLQINHACSQLHRRLHRARELRPGRFHDLPPLARPGEVTAWVHGFVAAGVTHRTLACFINLIRSH